MKVLKILNKSSSQQNMSLTVNIDTVRLSILEEALNRHLKTQVGIMGDKNARKDIDRASSGKAKTVKGSTATLTNAQIGFLHEFGSYALKIPERSFLRMPLMLFLKDAVNEGGAKINQAIEMADVHKAYAILGIAAEKVIQEGFASGGYGNWPKLRPITIALKGSSAILIDSGQLRKSITSKVVEA